MFAVFQWGMGDVITQADLPVEIARGRTRQAYLHRLGISGGQGQHFQVEEEKVDAEEDMSPNSRDFRQRYLQKLAYNNVWVPQVHRSPKHQTVIIFDWDDTLLCTTFLKHLTSTDEYQRPLRKIARCAKTVIDIAMRAGQVYIITNAMPGWVEYSAAKFIPELLPTLRKVRVISARAKYEKNFPDDIRQWKVQAFLEVQRQLDNVPITNLVALGDAHFEMEAARIMGDEFEEGLVKTVKFRPKSDPNTLLRQLELVAKSLAHVVSSAHNQKILLETDLRQSKQQEQE